MSLDEERCHNTNRRHLDFQMPPVLPMDMVYRYHFVTHSVFPKLYSVGNIGPRGRDHCCSSIKNCHEHVLLCTKSFEIPTLTTTSIIHSGNENYWHWALRTPTWDFFQVPPRKTQASFQSHSFLKRRKTFLLEASFPKADTHKEYILFRNWGSTQDTDIPTAWGRASRGHSFCLWSLPKKKHIHSP